MAQTSFYLYLGIIFSVALLGGLIPVLWKKSERALRASVSFGAGVLLGAAFLHMLPEAAELVGPSLGTGILVGFLLMYVTEKFIMTHPCEAEHCDVHTIGWTAFAGLTLHSLVDGVALGSSALVPSIGPAVALAILFHKLPASVTLSSVLLKSGFPPGRTEAAVAVFGAAVPVGAVVTRTLLVNVPHATLGLLIAFSAGTFIQIATDDLMPEIHRHHQGRFLNLLAFAAGLVMIAFGRAFSG